MKVLAVSNLFPPAFVGGYELGASWICRELAHRGHDVTVVTSSRLLWAHVSHYQDVACPPPVDFPFIDAGTTAFGFDFMRLIEGGYHESFDGAKLAIHDALIAAPALLDRLRDSVRRFAPDVVLVFNPAGFLTSPVQAILDACPAPPRLVSFVSDDWPTRWPGNHPLSALAALLADEQLGANASPSTLGLAKLLASEDLFAFERPLPIDLGVFCSDFLRRKCLAYDDAVFPRTAVAHWGLQDVATLPAAAARGFDTDEPLTLAFCGQLLHHKGLANLIRALPLTQQPHRLIVIGDDVSDYAATCKKLVETAKLTDRVEFVGKVAPDVAVHLMHERAQVLVVPSLVIPGQFEEPFSIVVLQGMAMGMPVIGTPTGGTPEAIVDGRNGRLCDVTDPAALAAAIDSLERDRAAAKAMGAAARTSVEQSFTIEKMVDRIAPLLAGRWKGLPSVRSNRISPAILMVATNASRDPANTGCVRVTRRLGRALEEQREIGFVAWDHQARQARPLTAAEREVLGRFNGPRIKDAAIRGIDPVAARVRAPERLRGTWILVPEVLPEEEFAAIRTYARLHGAQVAAIFYDAIPLHRPDLCAPHVGAGHAAYMRGLSRCDLVMAISDTAAHDLDTFWRERGLIVPKLVTWPLAGEVATTRPEVSALASHERGAPMMLCVSTLEPRKGHLRLLRALEILSRERPDLPWSLTLVGNRYAGADDLAATVEQAAARDPRIVWRGIVDDEELTRLYRQAAFTVYPSEIEGFGLPVAESLWFGRACVCSNAGAVGELARDGGCVTVDVLDERALADAIARLLGDATLRKRLSVDARNRHVRTWQACAEDVSSQLTPLPNASAQASTLTSRLYAGLLADQWQMVHAERLAFIQVLEELRPRCAIEIGTYRGGSLSVLARTSEVVFSLDIDPSVAERFGDFENVRFLTGRSQELLPELLRELRHQGLDPEFALVDGSHTAEDVRSDLSAFLAIRPRKPLVIIGHDSNNPECRRGMLAVDWQSSPYVSAVELDFVPGSAQTALTKPLDQLWGGLLLVKMDPEPRTGPLVVSSGAMRL